MGTLLFYFITFEFLQTNFLIIVADGVDYTSNISTYLVTKVFSVFFSLLCRSLFS